MCLASPPLPFFLLQLQKTGVFEVLCAVAIRMSRGHMWLLTVLLILLTAFISAWLDNVTTMLLLAPMTITVFATLGRNPTPLLIGMAIFSNLGGGMRHVV